MKHERRALVPADFERMNLPERYWRAKIQGVPESVRPAVERYLFRIDEHVARGTGLFVLGAAGVGKTAIAALVAKEARARGHTVFFTTVWELVASMRARAEFEDGVSIIDRCRDVDVLVVDDLSPDDTKDPFMGARGIEGLLVSRVERQRVTVITSKSPPDELRATYRSLLEATQDSLVRLAVIGPNQREQNYQKLEADVLGK